MCETCGCGDPDVVPVEVQESLLAANDRTADHNRQHFAGHGVVAINLMGSPGSGKTALLEATARALGGRQRLAAILESTPDPILVTDAQNRLLLVNPAARKAWNSAALSKNGGAIWVLK